MDELSSTNRLTLVNSLVGGLGFTAFLASAVYLVSGLEWGAPGTHEDPLTVAGQVLFAGAFVGIFLNFAAFTLLQWISLAASAKRVSAFLLYAQATIGGAAVGFAILTWHTIYLALRGSLWLQIPTEIGAAGIYAVAVYGLWSLTSKLFPFEPGEKPRNAGLAFATAIGSTLPFLWAICVRLS